LPDAEPVPAFVIGSKVTITGRHHPHKGKTGTIIAEFKSQGFDWIVELDGEWGPSVCATGNELRKNS
jgi:hypothetical protein